MEAGRRVKGDGHLGGATSISFSEALTVTPFLQAVHSGRRDSRHWRDKDLRNRDARAGGCRPRRGQGTCICRVCPCVEYTAHIAHT